MEEKNTKNNTLISLKNLSKSYYKGSKEIKVLNNINLDFEPGKFYLIVGHSGSGKSTLLKIMGLIDKPTNGEIFINNNNVNNLSDRKLAKFRNNEIGFVFQDYFLDKLLTAYENVTVPMIINKEYKKRKIVKKRALELLDFVGLKDRIKHFPKELSGGEEQRVAIARALANDPSIILADEPTGNLDVESEKFIFEKLKEMSKNGKCIIMVSHSKDAINYADKVLEVKDGVIL